MSVSSSPDDSLEGTSSGDTTGQHGRQIQRREWTLPGLHNRPTTPIPFQAGRNEPQPLINYTNSTCPICRRRLTTPTCICCTFYDVTCLEGHIDPLPINCQRCKGTVPTKMKPPVVYKPVDFIKLHQLMLYTHPAELDEYRTRIQDDNFFLYQLRILHGQDRYHNLVRSAHHGVFE
jgi:hypothetical protein